MKTTNKKIRDKNINKIMVRYIYIIRVKASGGKSRFYGQENILYTGQTNSIERRMTEHLLGINSTFLTKNFKGSRKVLVYVETLLGNEYHAIGREIQIKGLSKKKKEELIDSDKNMLVNYNPVKKVIIMKRHNDNTEHEAFKLKV